MIDSLSAAKRWFRARVSTIHTLALHALLHHHRADADNLVADEISSATATVDKHKSVASLKPKGKKQELVGAVDTAKLRVIRDATYLDIAPAIHI